MRQTFLNLVKKTHGLLVSERRKKVLSSLISELLSGNEKILDVGCGDGDVDSELIKKKGVDLTGIDVYKPKNAKIDMILYDGKRIPFSDRSFDCVLLVDAIHHAQDPESLLGEATRVAKKFLIIKDHHAESFFSRLILKFMDWSGNRPHNVVLPYNYWGSPQWKEAWRKLELKVVKNITKLGLYPWPFSLIFERDKHFIVKLEKKK